MFVNALPKIACSPAHHNTERQTQGRREKDVAVLNIETLLPREQSDDKIDADDAGPEDASWEV